MARPQFTPCEHCAPQFSSWNNQRELDFRRGLSNALETALGEKVSVEDVREAMAVTRALDDPKYAHVAAAMDHAFALGPEKVEPFLKGETVNAEDKAEFDKLRAELQSVKGELGQLKGTTTQVETDFTIERGEREIRRMFPGASDEQVREFFQKDVRTKGYVTVMEGGKQVIDWGATARAWRPDVFVGSAAPAGASADDAAAGALARPAGNGQTTREEPTQFQGPKEGEDPDVFRERARQEYYARVNASA